MTWHGQINRTIWEIETLLEKDPENFSLRRELLRTTFLQRYEFERSLHIARDDRSFLFMQSEPSPACLLLHGGNGTPAEMRDLGNYLYTKGHTVYCPRFSNVDSNNRVISWESWATSAENTLQIALRYSKDIFIIGLSLGGSLALMLTRMQKVKALVLLSPAIYPSYTMKERLIHLGRLMSPTLFYRFAGWKGEIIRAMEHVREHPAEILVPCLVLQARDDHRLSTRGLKLLRHLAVHPQSEVRLLPYGSHVLTRGEAREETCQRIWDFLHALS
ncbi:MAG: alpha/beta fold hydrolase [Candidatus Latescibacterota bacterium]